MRGHLALEDENLPIGQERFQVVVRAAVAEADLEHGTGPILDLSGCRGEAVALRLEPPNGAVKPAHLPLIEIS